MRGTPTLSERIYRLALRLYPGAFRRDFAHEMALDFDEAGREAWHDHGWRGLLAFWGRMSADVTATVAIQWLRTGVPLITLVSALVAVGVTSAAAQIIIVREPIIAALTPDDDALLLMMLMTGVVLSVIVATILFTFCFTRPRLRRRRT